MGEITPGGVSSEAALSKGSSADSARKPVYGEKREIKLNNGFHLVEYHADFGHGKVAIIQVIPPGVSKEQQAKTRKQIFIPGYSPSWIDQPKKLRGDLITLGEVNQASDTPIISVGVAFVGDRKHSARLVHDLPAGMEGVEVTDAQFTKAQDMVAGVSDLVKDNNAELMAHSLGGTIALTAVALGLPVDRVGLFNSAGLHKASKDKFILLKLFSPKMKARLIRSFDKVVDWVGRQGQDGEGRQSAWNRILQSRVENWAAYRSLVHPLLNKLELPTLLGNGAKDRVYPRRIVRKVMRTTGVAQNPYITFVDLPWDNHGLGRNQIKRRERLAFMAQLMREARQK